MTGAFQQRSMGCCVAFDMEDAFGTYVKHGPLSQTAVGCMRIERFIGHFGTLHVKPLELACPVGPESVNNPNLKMRCYSVFKDSKETSCSPTIASLQYEMVMVKGVTPSK